MEQHLKDITAPQEVEVSIRHDSKVLWINVDGKCQLRACQIGNLTIDDRRKPTQRPRRAKWEDEAMRLKDQNVSLLTALEQIKSHVPGRPGHVNLQDCHAQMIADATTAIEAATK